MICLVGGKALAPSFATHVQEGIPQQIAERHFPNSPDEMWAFHDSYINTLALIGNASR